MTVSAMWQFIRNIYLVIQMIDQADLRESIGEGVRTSDSVITGVITGQMTLQR